MLARLTSPLTEADQYTDFAAVVETRNYLPSGSLGARWFHDGPHYQIRHYLMYMGSSCDQNPSSVSDKWHVPSFYSRCAAC